MIRKIAFVLLVSLFFSIPLFAQYNRAEPELIIPEYLSLPYFAAIDDYVIPSSISNNDFYLESVRLNTLAQETFEFGDYDASAGFAEEAIRYALLSDEFVADELIIQAKRYLDWADSNNIARLHPSAYIEGKGYYETGVAALFLDQWSDSISSSVRAIEIFSQFIADTASLPPPSPPPSRVPGGVLPNQYTVRSWAVYRDCLWNIAGYSWVYGDPTRWRVLYEANKAKMPDPNNPDWIEPGMVLDIPSISGEVRQGVWDLNRTY
ncbi:MAG: LysM peptidoglycan-binding domain-containing protein [Treponema sp.]|jgi:hypothetical protein|nr:LysM peptidoglycan-binding domain-containing protein [Treponema sp.]